jgi:hypothetical protein
MPNQPLTPIVDLTEANGQWSMKYLGKTYGPGNYPPIIIDYNRKGDFTFKIQPGAVGSFDLSGPVGAITVAKGDAKPNGAGVYNQIAVSKDSTATVLKFSDSNTEKTHMNYVLHFTDQTTLDPIIQNGGGCCTFQQPGVGSTGLSTASFLGYLALAFFIGVIVTLLAQRLFGRSRNPAQSDSSAGVR